MGSSRPGRGAFKKKAKTTLAGTLLTPLLARVLASRARTPKKGPKGV